MSETWEKWITKEQNYKLIKSPCEKRNCEKKKWIFKRNLNPGEIYFKYDIPQKWTTSWTPLSLNVKMPPYNGWSIKVCFYTTSTTDRILLGTPATGVNG